MPGGDGTGPMGAGPMTGRSAGFCSGYPTAGYGTYGRGRGFWGCGGGRGWRRWFHATGLPGRMRAPMDGPADAQAEKQALKNQLGALQSELEFVKERLAQLDDATLSEGRTKEKRP